MHAKNLSMVCQKTRLYVEVGCSPEDPQGSANHLVLGMNKEQRQAARSNSRNSVPTWV